MIPSVARAAITLILAGWCAVLPVFAQLCPCTVAGPISSASADINPSSASLATAKKSCCGHCSAQPAPDSAAIGWESDDDQSAPCRCDDVSRFELFLAEVSNTDRSVSDAVEPLSTVAASISTVEASEMTFERAPPFVLPHLRKLACLGVWRL
ncbi:MAG: hypothetical protein CBB71_18885 [Rhodopirellula sp. TMED11]|nr:MAG: hypothetical protein CBB71_18885 [Rhodopirellula sp. TMED11]